LGNKRRYVVRSLFLVNGYEFVFSFLKTPTRGTGCFLKTVMCPYFAKLFFAVFRLKEKLKKIQWLFFLTAFAGGLVLKRI